MSEPLRSGKDLLLVNGTSTFCPKHDMICEDTEKNGVTDCEGEVYISRKRQNCLKDETKKKIDVSPYNINAHKKAKCGSPEPKDENYKAFVDSNKERKKVAISLGVQLRDSKKSVTVEDFDCDIKIKTKTTYEKEHVIYDSTGAINHLLRDLAFVDDCGVIIENCKKLINISEEKTYSQGKDYIETDELGKGGSGVVSLVTDKISGKQFVSKRIKKDIFDVKEVSVMSLLKHENITQFFGILVSKQEVQLLQTYAGRSLCNLSKKGWSEDEIIDLSIQALSALDLIHSYGIIHMDIKPDNVCVILETNHLYLTDFGSCKTPQHAVNGKGLTPEYMAPELCRHIANNYLPTERKYAEEEITGKNDVYTWALTTGYMIEGQHIMLKYMKTSTPQEFQHSRIQFPFSIAADPGFMQKIFPDTVSEDMRRVIERCLAGTTAERCSAIEGMNQFIGLQESRQKNVVQPLRLQNHINIKAKLNDKLKQRTGPIPEILEPKIECNTETGQNCPDFGALFSD